MSTLPAWQLPDADRILFYGESGTDSVALVRQQASIIEKTLTEFNIPVQIVEIKHAPTITWFGLRPLSGSSQKANKSSLKEISEFSIDLCVALSSSAIELENVLPGKDYFAIGVPKDELSLGTLKNLIKSEPFARLAGRSLRVALGVDTFGNAVCYDLATFPHLLISGTTNSGKSVCVNAILACLLLGNTPDDLRLILVDSKGIELSQYNGIPHLLTPIIVDPKRVLGALQWLTREMDKRYAVFSQMSKRNIDAYNSAIKVMGGRNLPHLMLVIDDLSDIMTFAPDFIEETLAHLSRMGQAVRIHIILTANRLASDVLSNTVKTYFPARIAFKVVSTRESRMILNEPGAEKLTGNGDMLVLTPNLPRPLRVQGVFVPNLELENLLNYWKATVGRSP